MIFFPKNFTWGASTSSYCHEGGCPESVWRDWELRAGRILDGSSAQCKTGLLEQYPEVFGLARKLGHNAHFMTLEWSRIEPGHKEFDDAALAQYAEMLRCLQENGLEPCCALYHGSSPDWFEQQKGWTHPQSAEWFRVYAEHVARHLGTLCSRWIPIHEPAHYGVMAYLMGVWPPGRKSIRVAMKVLNHMASAHCAATEVFKQMYPDTMLGMPLGGYSFSPHDCERVWDVRSVLSAYDWYTQRFGKFVSLAQEESAGSQPDFIAVSYHGDICVQFNPIRWRTWGVEPLDDAERFDPSPRAALCPQGLLDTLRKAAEYTRPIIVTGCGLATEDDTLRCQALVAYLVQIHKALLEGIPVEGLYYRSLLDGFEWHEGRAARHGLVHIEHETQTQTPNNSAWLYKDICETHALRKGTLARFCRGFDMDMEEELTSNADDPGL